MRRLKWIEVVVTAVLGITLFALSLVLVNVQYRSRTLFVEHERAIDIGRKLSDDEAELLLKVRKASLPGNIVAEAEKAGLIHSTEEETINLVYAEDGSVKLAADIVGAEIEVTRGARSDARVRMRARE